VKNGITLKLYVNGNFISVSTDVIPDPIDQGSGNFDLGTGPGYDAGLKSGVLLDEVAIYSEALTLSQIHQLHAEGLIRHVLAFR